MVDHRVVAGVLRLGDSVLLCHRRLDRRWYPDVWDLPGGHIGQGEEPVVALAREMREELGVRIDAPDEGPVAVILDEDAGFELSIWVLDRWQGDVVNAAPGEHDEARWFCGPEIVSVKLAHPRLLGVLQTALGGTTRS